MSDDFLYILTDEALISSSQGRGSFVRQGRRAVRQRCARLPRVRTRDRGLYLARLAMACANAGAEPDCSGVAGPWMSGTGPARSGGRLSPLCDAVPWRREGLARGGPARGDPPVRLTRKRAIRRLEIHVLDRFRG
jgi:hypothetical protein